MPPYTEDRRRRADDHALIEEFTQAVVSIFAVLDLPTTPSRSPSSRMTPVVW